MKYVVTTIATMFILGVISLMVFFGLTPMGKTMWNGYQYTLQKVDDRTLYETRKKVEDEARAMVASYKADKLKYEQYSTSSDKEQKSWGEQAKMRANQTASTYNNYILVNSYVFQGNVPADINFQLQIIP